MKKKFTVEVEIDTDSDVSMALFPTSVRQSIKDRYAITIVNDTKPEIKNEHDVLCSLVHELGHVVGYALELPRSSVDPRLILGRRDSDIPPGDRIYHAEEEAWDIGEAIISLQKQREFYLKTYEWRRS
jgi:hypothetical protein